MGFFDDVELKEDAEDVSATKAKREAAKKKEVEPVSISPDELLDNAFEEMMPVNEYKNEEFDDYLPDDNDLEDFVEKEMPAPKEKKVEEKSSARAKENVPGKKVDTKSIQGDKKPIASDGNTVISSDTVVDGSISSHSPLSICGKVSGNVQSDGEVVIQDTAEVRGGATSETGIVVHGLLKGAVSAESVVVNGRVLSGEIQAGKVDVSESAVVIAPISATRITITGAVKGDVNAKEKVILKSTAIVQGNIASASITIEDGASIDGTCTQTYAKVKPADFFNNMNLDD